MRERAGGMGGKYYRVTFAASSLSIRSVRGIPAEGRRTIRKCLGFGDCFSYGSLALLSVLISETFVH